jgi:RsiW-degrading membrane proteinase PrsW (M82 family)
MSPRRFLWLALCFFLGIAGGFLTAEIIGLPLALILPTALVLVGRHRGQGMATLLSYSAGFELLALWVGLPAVLPSSWATPAHPSQTLVLAGLMLVLGITMGAAAFLPAVRGKR